MITRVGAKFREARIRQRLTLEKVSESTKIRKEFLEAIESGEYKVIPSSAYAYGFVRNYAQFLDLPEDHMIALFKREYDVSKNYEVLPKGLPKMDNIPMKGIRIGRNPLIIFGILIFIVLFILFQYKDAIFSPQLNVYQPKDKSEISSSEVEVRGSTDANSVVYVDNNLVSVDNDGNFRKVIAVFPGKSMITIKSVNRFGRESIDQRHILVKTGY